MNPGPDLGAGSRPYGLPGLARNAVFAEHGMAATAHPQASRIAIDVLEAGGSAVDAAIAANAALGLMEPTACGIGGDLFAIVWDSRSGRLYGYNGSGRSPKSRSLAAMRKRAGPANLVPFLGSYSVTVPGAVDGWFALHEQFGKQPMREILSPAIAAAKAGFAVTPVIAALWAENMAALAGAGGIEEFENAHHTYLVGGHAPRAGDVFRNPDLAASYELIAREGRDAFYKGEIARATDSYMKRIKGDLRFEDFAAHRGDWVRPGTTEYRGYEVHELPPNGQGFAVLEMLNILKNVDLAQWGRGSAEVLHYLVEAKRLAYEDLAKFYADPDFYEPPLDALLSDAYGRARFAEIDPTRAMPSPKPGEPAIEAQSDTTYLTVADKAGMMVSLIQSNFSGLGSGLVPDNLGFMLQNRGALFSLKDGSPNLYAPEKRPFHTIIPGFVTKDGKPYISFGLMGGSMQPQGHVQVLVNIIDFGMDLQTAGDAARFFQDGGRQPTGAAGDPVGTLSVEPGVPTATIERLRALGHVVEVVDDGGVFGGYQAIRRDLKTGIYEGATEMRKDGEAIGY
jgi:gamma-glutamyltranspeptidase / glutathione hydrolase